MKKTSYIIAAAALLLAAACTRENPVSGGSVAGDGMALTVRLDGADTRIAFAGEVDGIPVRTIGKKGMESILGRGINNTVETLTIEEGVQEIGDYAFFGLRQLRKAELPDSVTKIGGYAFSSCYVLSEVRFPKDLKASGPVLDGPARLVLGSCACRHPRRGRQAAGRF